ncbi:MAG TPA: response regulator [Nevskiaceae bacterium]|nr:response regulator [Nevskiaceae bacterium]
MSNGIVFIVDDEEAVRDSIDLLVRSAAFQTETFASAHEFLASYSAERAGCLVLDVRMPRMSGLELQQELNRRGWIIPVIFITGHGDVPMAVEAMREGALDFLQKPFNDEVLIQRVHMAIDHDARQRAQLKAHDELSRRLATLTPREREIADRLVAGQANKVIAIELGLSERTVEVHRARIMTKLEVRGIAQLVQVLGTVREQART